MSAKNITDDPQDTKAPALFPMDTVDQQKVYQRIAQNFCRIERLRHKLALETKPLKDEIDKLTRLNRTLIEELEQHPEPSK